MSLSTDRLFLTLHYLQFDVKLWSFVLEHHSATGIGVYHADGITGARLANNWMRREVIDLISTEPNIGLIVNALDSLPSTNNKQFMADGLRRLRDAGLVSDELYLKHAPKFTRGATKIRISESDLSEADLEAAGLTRTDLWIFRAVVSSLSKRGHATAQLTAVGLPIGSNTNKPQESLSGADMAITWVPVTGPPTAGPSTAGPSTATLQPKVLAAGHFELVAASHDLHKFVQHLEPSNADLSTLNLSAAGSSSANPPMPATKPSPTARPFPAPSTRAKSPPRGGPPVTPGLSEPALTAAKPVQLSPFAPPFTYRPSSGGPRPAAGQRTQSAMAQPVDIPSPKDPRVKAGQFSGSPVGQKRKPHSPEEPHVAAGQRTQSLRAQPVEIPWSRDPRVAAGQPTPKDPRVAAGQRTQSPMAQPVEIPSPKDPRVKAGQFSGSPVGQKWKPHSPEDTHVAAGQAAQSSTVLSLRASPPGAPQKTAGQSAQPLTAQPHPLPDPRGAAGQSAQSPTAHPSTRRPHGVGSARKTRWGPDMETSGPSNIERSDKPSPSEQSDRALQQEGSKKAQVSDRK